MLAVSSPLFTHYRHLPIEEFFSVSVYVGGLSPRWISEELSITGASRESVRLGVHRFSKLYKPSKRVRRLVAADEVIDS